MVLSAIACNEKNKATIAPERSATAVLPAAAVQGAKDSIMNQSVVNNAGDTLKQSYNFTKGTAVFEFNGERITVKRDTASSFIQYSNEHYIYKEHRGDVDIHKDGKLVWDNIR